MTTTPTLQARLALAKTKLENTDIGRAFITTVDRLAEGPDATDDPIADALETLRADLDTLEAASERVGMEDYLANRLARSPSEIADAEDRRAESAYSHSNDAHQ